VEGECSASLNAFDGTRIRSVNGFVFTPIEHFLFRVGDAPGLTALRPGEVVPLEEAASPQTLPDDVPAEEMPLSLREIGPGELALDVEDWRFRLMCVDLRGATARGIPTKCFQCLPWLREANVGDASALGLGAFLFCPNLKALTLSDATRKLDRLSLEGCVALTRFRLPIGLEFVGDLAFAGVKADLDFRECAHLQEACLNMASSGVVRFGVGYRGRVALCLMDSLRVLVIGSVVLMCRIRRRYSVCFDAKLAVLFFTALVPPRMAVIDSREMAGQPPFAPDYVASVLADAEESAAETVSNAHVFGEVAALWRRETRPATPP
jgi:hypothetical protein